MKVDLVSEACAVSSRMLWFVKGCDLEATHQVSLTSDYKKPIICAMPIQATQAPLTFTPPVDCLHHSPRGLRIFRVFSMSLPCVPHPIRLCSTVCYPKCNPAKSNASPRSLPASVLVRMRKWQNLSLQTGHDGMQVLAHLMMSFRNGIWVKLRMIG